MTNYGNLARLSPSPEIRSLESLDSPEAIQMALERVANSYGKTTSIMPLPLSKDDDGDQCGFLVCFENTQDAMTASRTWRCLQFGFTSVIVSLRCNGQPGESA
ncbi:hypothetical protein [Propionivibrio limicola]|uniref:hypothetical protein n=1 Tax=Propionivibrio limicola TaxID=167645 RepID=UPI001290DF20|nr:hypothetical protein [Propionivibrio limicola]